MKLKNVISISICLSLLGLPAFSKTEPFKVASIGNMQRDAMIVRIATGDAHKKSGSGEWIPIAIGADLGNDDVIKTGKNSTVLLELPENTGFIRLLPETEVRVNQIKVDRGFDGGQIAELSVVKGKVITKVRKFNRKSSKLQINTKGATAAVRGTSFLASYSENTKETKVIVGDGKVAVKAQDEEVVVKPKELTKVGLGNKPLDPYLVGNNLDFSLSKITPSNNTLNFTGITDPDAQINLNKSALFANSDGSFTGNLSLNEGENQIAIKASTIDGRLKVTNLKVLKFTE